MIADELKHQFDITLDKKKIHLIAPVKTLGEHEIDLPLHAEVKTMLKIRVESLNPIAAPVAASVEEKPHTEKRGHRGDIVAPTTEEIKSKSKPAKKAKAE
jgi:large subunit ribosomal protein L9